MLARAGPSGLPMATPSICLYMILLKLNFTKLVAMFMSLMITFFPCLKKLIRSYITSPHIVSTNGIFVKKLAMSKEHMIVSCGLVVRFRSFLAKAKESLMQRTEYRLKKL